MKDILFALSFLFLSTFASAQTLCAGVATSSACVTDGTRTITFNFDCAAETYTVTMVGPEDEWMGILFGTLMFEGSNALIYTSEGGVGAVRSYFVDGYDLPGGTANYAFTTMSDNTDSGVRTVVAGPRAFDSGQSNEITFTTSDVTMPIRLTYHGNGSLELVQHAASGSSFLAANLDLRGKPLPLDFLGFDVSIQDKAVRLDWTIANAINVNSMIIQRSIDAKSWEDLAIYSLSTNTSDYTHIDKKPYPASNYYRIKTLDEDGSEHYSSVTTVLIPVTNIVKDAVLFAPNPFQDNLDISVSHEFDLSDLVEVNIMDVSHRLVLQETMPLSEVEALDFSNLSTGTYYVMVVHTDWMQMSRLIKI